MRIKKQGVFSSIWPKATRMKELRLAEEKEGPLLAENLNSQKKNNVRGASQNQDFRRRKRFQSIGNRLESGLERPHQQTVTESLVTEKSEKSKTKISRYFKKKKIHRLGWSFQDGGSNFLKVDDYSR